MSPATSAEGSTRADLAAAFRWAARLNFHEATANHFSVAVSDDGSQFLLNPRGRHFSAMRASELLLLNARDRREDHRRTAADIDLRTLGDAADGDHAGASGRLGAL